MPAYTSPQITIDEGKFGVVERLEMPAPSVYRVYTTLHGCAFLLPADYQGGSISPAARSFGVPVDDLLLFDLYHGRTVIEYELALSQRRKAVTGTEKSYWDGILLELYHDGQLYFPDYFGPCPPPAATPDGPVTRVQTLQNGIYLVDTAGRPMLALSAALADVDCETLWPDYTGVLPSEPGYLFFRREHLPLVLPTLAEQLPALADLKF